MEPREFGLDTNTLLRSGYGETTPSELRPRKIDEHVPRVEATLGLELANAFSVKGFDSERPNSSRRAKAPVLMRPSQSTKFKALSSKFKDQKPKTKYQLLVADRRRSATLIIDNAA